MCVCACVARRGVDVLLHARAHVRTGPSPAAELVRATKSSRARVCRDLADAYAMLGIAQVQLAANVPAGAERNVVRGRRRARARARGGGGRMLGASRRVRGGGGGHIVFLRVRACRDPVGGGGCCTTATSRRMPRAARRRVSRAQATAAAEAAYRAAAGVYRRALVRAATGAGAGALATALAAPVRCRMMCPPAAGFLLCVHLCVCVCVCARARLSVPEFLVRGGLPRWLWVVSRNFSARGAPHVHMYLLAGATLFRAARRM